MPIARARSPWFALAMLIASVAAAQQAQPADAALEQTLVRFVGEWLDAAAAPSRFDGLISTLPTNRSFLPIEALDPAEARLDLTGRPLAAGDFARAMGTFLTRIRPGGREVLQPVDAETAPELWDLLKSRDVSPRYLRSVPALAYRLTRFESFEWIVPRTPAHRRAIPELIAGGRQVEGVICRIVRPGDPPALLFMFWVNEGVVERPAWRLLGLSAVPAH